VTAGSIVLAPAIIVGGLNAVGFTSSGVAGGRFLVPLYKELNCALFYNLFRFYSRWDTVKRIWRTNNWIVFYLSVLRGDVGSRVGLCDIWHWVSHGWRDVPLSRTEEEQN
jgi:hypothetical protein